MDVSVGGPLGRGSWTRIWVWAVAVFLSISAITTQARGETILITKHCLLGCPSGGGPLVHRDSYVLRNNAMTKFADWVAYVVQPSGLGPPRSRTWRSDPDLPEDQTLEPDDYVRAHAVLHTDRGHQAPLASFAGAPDWAATNYLSNITPQRSALNQGPWVALETAVRRLAARLESVPVYVVTGPLFERTMPALPNADEDHLVPSGYWKLIARRDGDRIRAAAFVMDQDTKRSADFCAPAFQSPIALLEARTGLRFFPMAQDAAVEPLASAALGCE